ncbi:hypothetical protein [Caballeronia sp. AZ7_KS35]|uniref:hypothetical protein n=1 Tax=Caballeronia sp. AZ7_KS35 TaxID=2921762 RepID=UPI002028B83D|nr:hypothetical protein [Caballeronia sp. AZ7_KS35]
MANFLESFNKGIAAARDAERNKAEIQEVFDDLNQQLAVATAGKVAIRRRQFNAAIDILGQKNALLSLLRPEKYWGLAAIFLPSGTVEATELAKWEEENSGYPCTVTIGSQRYVCEDRAALEGVLETVLADPSVGEVLHALMQMPIPVSKA